MGVEPNLPHKSGGSYDPELLRLHILLPNAACPPKVGTCHGRFEVGISSLDAFSFQ